MTATPNKKMAVITNWAPSFEGIGHITASDIDGICERNGNFLIIESKHESELLGKGQAIMLAELSKLPQFEVFIVVMADKSSGLVDKFYYLNKGVGGELLYGHEKWCEVVQRWWKKANG